MIGAWLGIAIGLTAVVAALAVRIGWRRPRSAVPDARVVAGGANLGARSQRRKSDALAMMCRELTVAVDAEVANLFTRDAAGAPWLLRARHGGRLMCPPSWVASSHARLAASLGRVVLDADGFSAVLAAPVRDDGRVVAVVELRRTGDRPFSEREVARLRTFDGLGDATTVPPQAAPGHNGRPWTAMLQARSRRP